MTALEVRLQDELLGSEVLVGILSKRSGRTGEAIDFEYASEWLRRRGPIRAFALDLDLPLAPGKHYARTGASELSGAFQDCSPDRWGSLLMQRRELIEAKEQGRQPRALRAWDYLVGVNDEGRMGAIRLREPGTGSYLDARSLSAPPMTELRTLEAIALQLDEGREDWTDEQLRWIKPLIAPAASLGGARPKASFRDQDGALWIAKFPSAQDTHDVGLWEYVTHRLALMAGITMPQATILRLSSHGHTFAVKRFDRSNAARRCYASAMTMLGASDSDGRSYLDIAEVIESSGAAHRIDQELEQLFRRVFFGILVGNRDDHLRNHGFLRESDGWALSPAFDINPSTAKDVHVLAIDESDPSPCTQSALRTAEYYRIKQPRAMAIAQEVRQAVIEWEHHAASAGAKGLEIQLMRSVIDPGR